MWMTKLFSLIFSHYEPEAENSPLDRKAIRDIRVSLYTQKQLNADALIKQSAPDLIEALCALRISVDQLEHPTFKGADALITAIDTLLATESRFSDTDILDSHLQTYEVQVEESDRRVKRLRKRKRTLLFAITLVPIVAYGVHWSLASFVRQASLVQMDVVYPNNIYQASGQRLGLKRSAQQKMLDEFHVYYFGLSEPEEFIRQQLSGVYSGRFNPVPHRFNPKVAETWGVSPKIIENTHERNLEALYNDHNLLVTRSFIKNIKAGNIVSRVGLEVTRLDSEEFPWQQMDVNSNAQTFVTEPVENIGFRVGMRVESVPVTDANVQVKIVGTLSDKPHQFEFSKRYVNKSVSEVVPDNIGVVGFNMGRYGVLLSKEFLASVDLSEGKEVHWRELRRLEHNLGAFEGFYYSLCPDGGAAVLFPMGGVDVPWMDRIQFVELEYDYRLLNGKMMRGKDKHELSLGTYLLREGMSTSDDIALSCERGRIYQHDLDVTEATGMSDTLALIDGFASALATQGKAESPVIAVEETIHFDLAFESASMSSHLDKVVVLEDGHYVLLNLVLTDFTGGDYRIRYFFDDDVVAESVINLPWPSSHSFKRGDEALFRGGQP
jgi:hypothetical protein